MGISILELYSTTAAAAASAVAFTSLLITVAMPAKNALENRNLARAERQKYREMQFMNLLDKFIYTLLIIHLEHWFVLFLLFGWKSVRRSTHTPQIVCNFLAILFFPSWMLSHQSIKLFGVQKWSAYFSNWNGIMGWNEELLIIMEKYQEECMQICFVENGKIPIYTLRS